MSSFCTSEPLPHHLRSTSYSPFQIEYEPSESSIDPDETHPLPPRNRHHSPPLRRAHPSLSLFLAKPSSYGARIAIRIRFPLSSFK